MSESAPPPGPPVAVVLLAGGRGTRAGFGRPKQLASLGRKPMLQWSLDAFAGHPAISGGVLVANDAVMAAIGPLPEDWISADPGAARQPSVGTATAAPDGWAEEAGYLDHE